MSCDISVGRNSLIFRWRVVSELPEIQVYRYIPVSCGWEAQSLDQFPIAGPLAPLVPNDYTFVNYDFFERAVPTQKGTVEGMYYALDRFLRFNDLHIDKIHLNIANIGNILSMVFQRDAGIYIYKFNAPAGIPVKQMAFMPFFPQGNTGTPQTDLFTQEFFLETDLIVRGGFAFAVHLPIQLGVPDNGDVMLELSIKKIEPTAARYECFESKANELLGGDLPPPASLETIKIINNK